MLTSDGARQSIAPFDALLLLSFGGPEAPEEVVPFLENVTRGRGIPRERLEQVGEHYYLFGGKSPINDQNRALLAAIRRDLDERGLDLPVYWGNRNWDPYLADAMREMVSDGVERAAVFPTSAYSSYSSCRQYRENLADAVAEVPGAPELDRLRQYFNHPGFVEPFIEQTLAAIEQLDADERAKARLVFVTHSIPESMNAASGPQGEAYVAQHRSVMDVITSAVNEHTGQTWASDLVYCSRSGAPHIPWLEPDINDHLTAIADQVSAVIMIPIGFISDHMEVIYDLDTEAMATAQDVGLRALRVPTPGTHPKFVSMIVDLVLERAATLTDAVDQPTPTAVGGLGAWPAICAVGCCANAREARPALGEAPGGDASE